MNSTPRRRYTDEFKSQAVTLAQSIGCTAAARQLDMSPKTLANWLGAFRRGQPLGTGRGQPVSEQQAELSRLRAENATLKMERDISRKAAAFFAKESR